MLLIEGITDKIISEFRLEHPEVEYFAQDEDDRDLDKMVFCMRLAWRIVR
jgi:hypothetical protein